MKINTDGVLLGALADAVQPKTILDIGTGTGVIALMLAQKFVEAKIDAVEIDSMAAQTAKLNFENSVFSDRLSVYAGDITSFFQEHPERKYDLIVSNPPFYINSLTSPKERKTIAKHTAADFFETLIRGIASHLSDAGLCWLVLPPETAKLVIDMIKQNGLFLQRVVAVRSYPDSPPHREMLCFGLTEMVLKMDNLVIYEQKDVYSDDYKKLLQPYFLAF
jgi:tRNA1Val (adenine37-N6)-methyltransferase